MLWPSLARASLPLAGFVHYKCTSRHNRIKQMEDKVKVVSKLLRKKITDYDYKMHFFSINSAFKKLKQW